MTAPLAVQLYSLRDATATDLPGVLGALAAQGYVGVESAGLAERTPAEFAALLAEHGLTLASAHVGHDDDPGVYTAALEAHAAAGATTAVIPALWPKHFADLDAVSRAADLINAARDRAEGLGLRLGYHNHFWELALLADRPALLHLFDRVHPDVVAEIDIYWAVVGGVDAAALVTELGDRVRLLHVKDGPADGHESDMVAVGDGVIPVAEILAAGTAAEWHIVELDRCATDMLTAVGRSLDHLVGAGLSRGRDGSIA